MNATGIKILAMGKQKHLLSIDIGVFLYHTKLLRYFDTRKKDSDFKIEQMLLMFDFVIKRKNIEFVRFEICAKICYNK